MSICNFINFNAKCPICDSPLTLYMQWMKSVCFKATRIEPNTYQFDTFKCNNLEFGENENMMLTHDNKSFKTIFNNSKIGNLSKNFNIYFFYLCNELSFVDVGSHDYNIDTEKVCYYRSSNNMEFKKQDRDPKKWILSDLDENKFINKYEHFTIKVKDDVNTKFYMIKLDYEKEITELTKYTTSEEKDAIFKSYLEEDTKSFSKEMPLLNNKLDFSNKDKLLNRLESWIVMS